MTAATRPVDKKEPTNPSLAVVIPTYRREQVLCQTIQEIINQSIIPDEFIIVDQSEEHDQATINFLKEHEQAGRLRWIRHRPPSLSGARNRAYRETKSDILLFIDDDILTYNNFLLAHQVNYLDQSVDAVCGQVREPHGALKDELHYKLDWTNPFDVNYKFPRNYSRRTDVPGVICGGNFSIRRNAINTIGGFNMYTAIKGEDSDIAFRLFEKGCRIIFDPKAYIIHLAAPTGGCRPGIKRTWREECHWAAGYPYLAFRYIRGLHKRYFLWIMWLTMRSTFLYKGNMASPLKFIRSGAVCIRAIFLSYRWAKLRQPLVPMDW